MCLQWCHTSSKIFIPSCCYLRPECFTKISCFCFLGNTVNNTVADTDVSYYCATATQLPSYVKSTISVPPVTTGSLFDYTMPNSTCSDSCGNDICTDFNSIPDPVVGTGLPDRCGFDDGFTRAPTPRIVGNTCEGVVLDVRWVSEWDWLVNATCNDISVKFVMAHRCAVGLKKKFGC